MNESHSTIGPFGVRRCLTVLCDSQEYSYRPQETTPGKKNPSTESLKMGFYEGNPSQNWKASLMDCVHCAANESLSQHDDGNNDDEQP